MVTEFEKIDKRFENMVTKEEFAAESGRTQQQFDKLDERFDTIDERFDTVDERFNTIEAHTVQTDKNVLSLQEMFKTLVVKIDEQSKSLSSKIDEQEKTLSVKIDEQEKRLSLFQKVTYVFFSTIIVILAGILLKLIIK